MGLIVEAEGYKDKQHNERAQQIVRYEDVIPIVKQYETKIRNKKQYTLYCLRQVCVFKKFKESNSFIDTVEDLQSGTKYFAKSAKIKQNSTRPQSFDICFCVSFGR